MNIILFGELLSLTTETAENAHIRHVSDPYEASNKRDLHMFVRHFFYKCCWNQKSKRKKSSSFLDDKLHPEEGGIELLRLPSPKHPRRDELEMINEAEIRPNEVEKKVKRLKKRMN